MRRIIEVTREKEVNVPIEKVFNFVAEYGNTLKYTPYLVRFEPTTEIKRGSGARFRMVGKIFGIPFKSELEVFEFVENRSLRLETISGSQIRIQWLFRPTEKGTRVVYITEYTVPLGLVGAIVSRLILRKFLHQGSKKTLQKLKALLEK